MVTISKLTVTNAKPIDATNWLTLRDVDFRQWLEWEGRPCSNYASWYFQARWKDQRVTLKDVDQGAITLPPQAF